MVLKLVPIEINFAVLVSYFHAFAFSEELGGCFLWVQRKAEDRPTTCYFFRVYNQNQNSSPSIQL